MSNLRIAFIGSRKLSEEQFQKEAKLFYQVAFRCAELGIILRSGLAEGADGIAQVAYSDAIAQGLAHQSQLEVFIADEYARRKSNLPNKHLAIVRNPNLIEETELMASKVHPNWKACNQWARALHSRNCHQIFGYNLDEPVQATFCWTHNGLDVGGTRTAIVLSRNAGIPVFNLGHPDKDFVLSSFRECLEQLGVKGLKPRP